MIEGRTILCFASGYDAPPTSKHHVMPKRLSGQLQLTTLMSGVLYLDGNALNNGNVVETGLSVPLEITAGDHLLEMKSDKGVWSNQFLMMPNEKISLTAKLKTKTVSKEVPKERKIDYEKVYLETAVDEKASPENGLKKFYTHLARSIKYPSAAYRNKIQGRVYIEFVVDLDGSIDFVNIIRGFDKDCDAEAVRVVRNSENWIPAKITGRPVKQKVIIPVSFRVE